MKIAVIAIVAALVGAAAVVGFQRAANPGTAPVAPATATAASSTQVAQPQPATPAKAVAPVLMHLANCRTFSRHGILCGNVAVEQVPEGERFAFQVIPTKGSLSDLASESHFYDMIRFEIRRPHATDPDKQGELLWWVFATRTPADLDYQRIAAEKPFDFSAVVPTDVIERFGRSPNVLWIGRYGFAMTSFDLTYLPGATLTRAEAETHLAAAKWPRSAKQ